MCSRKLISVFANRDFLYAYDGIHIIELKKGDIFEQEERHIKGMQLTGKIAKTNYLAHTDDNKVTDDVKPTDFGADLEKTLIKKDEPPVVPVIENPDAPVVPVINIDSMDKNKLEIYARDTFNVDIDKRKSLENLRLQVSGLKI